MRRFALLLLLLETAPAIRAQTFRVDRADPPIVHASGGSFRLLGSGLDAATALRTSPGWPVRITAAESSALQAELPPPPGGRSGILLVQAAAPGQAGPWVPLLVDALPLHAEAELRLPCAAPGQVPDQQWVEFSFAATRNRPVTLDCLARRLGSPLDPWLSVIDESGRELLFLDDAPGLMGDPCVHFVPPRTGRYRVRIRDVEFKGGPQHRFLLRAWDRAVEPADFLDLAPPAGAGGGWEDSEPNNRKAEAAPIEVPGLWRGLFQAPGDTDWLRIQLEKELRLVLVGRMRDVGAPGDLGIEIWDEAERRQGPFFSLGPGEVRVHSKLAPGTYWIRVQEVNRKGGPKFRYALELLTTPPLFEASTEQDRPRLEPGGGCVVKVTVNRRDYKGPVMFRAEGIEGVQVDPATLAENQESLELRLQLPPSFSGWGDLQLIGVTPGDSRPIQVSTRPALRKQFPGVLFPLPFLDGRITLHAAPASTVGRGD